MTVAWEEDLVSRIEKDDCLLSSSEVNIPCHLELVLE